MLSGNLEIKPNEENSWENSLRPVLPTELKSRCAYRPRPRRNKPAEQMILWSHLLGERKVGDCPPHGPPLYWGRSNPDAHKNCLLVIKSTGKDSRRDPHFQETRQTQPTETDLPVNLKAFPGRSPNPLSPVGLPLHFSVLFQLRNFTISSALS